MKTLPMAPSSTLHRSVATFARTINSLNNTTITIAKNPRSFQFRQSRKPLALTPPLAMASSSSTQSPPQNVSGVDATADDLNVLQLVQSHQEKAARLPPIEEVRTVLDHSLRGMLSTFSQKHEGYPSSSMVDFACDAYGSPILAVSSLAVHTKVSEKDREAIRTAYLARHPNAFWVDFGDFQFVRIEPQAVRYVSGVATASLGSGEFTKEEYRAAKVDPIYQFSKPIASHMNRDHAEDTKLIVQHSTSIPVDFAQMLDVDSLGFYVKAGCKGDTFKLRVPFPRRAADRKG